MIPKGRSETRTHALLARQRILGRDSAGTAPAHWQTAAPQSIRGSSVEQATCEASPRMPAAPLMAPYLSCARSIAASLHTPTGKVNRASDRETREPAIIILPAGTDADAREDIVGKRRAHGQSELRNEGARPISKFRPKGT